MSIRCLNAAFVALVRFPLAAGVLLAVLTTASMPVAADPWSNALEIRGGAVVMDIDSSFRVDSRSLGKGTTIDAEDDLGLDDDDSVFRGELAWRFARRHKISAGYMDLSRDARTVTEEEYQVGDVVFPAGVPVATDFDLSLVDFSYSYSLVQTDRFEIAPLVGVYWLDFDVEVRSDALGLREGDSEELPLPTFGARAVYQLSPSWRLMGNAQYFSISYDDYDGEIIELGAGVEWNVWSRLSLGAGYSRIDLDVENKKSNGGRGEYVYDGLWVYAGVAL
jgi:hypothetical protein